MSNTGAEALRELLERVKENPNDVGDADLGLHRATLAELEALEGVLARSSRPATVAQPGAKPTASPAVSPLAIADVEGDVGTAPE